MDMTKATSAPDGGEFQGGGSRTGVMCKEVNGKEGFSIQVPNWELALYGNSNPNGYHNVGWYSQQLCRKSDKCNLGRREADASLSTRVSGNWNNDWCRNIQITGATCKFFKTVSKSRQ